MEDYNKPKSSTIEGKILHIFDENVFSDRFKKKEFVIETHNAKYPQTIKLELHNSYCDLIYPYSVGMNIKCTYDLRGKEYGGKFYNSVVAWKLEKGDNEVSTSKQRNSTITKEEISEDPTVEDDLPF